MSSEVGTAADSGVVVRAVSEEDRASWRALYRGYRDFYKVPHSDDAIDTEIVQYPSVRRYLTLGHSLSLNQQLAHCR